MTVKPTKTIDQPEIIANTFIVSLYNILQQLEIDGKNIFLKTLSQMPKTDLLNFLHSYEEIVKLFDVIPQDKIIDIWNYIYPVCFGSKSGSNEHDKIFDHFESNTDSATIWWWIKIHIEDKDMCLKVLLVDIGYSFWETKCIIEYIHAISKDTTLKYSAYKQKYLCKCDMTYPRDTKLCSDVRESVGCCPSCGRCVSTNWQLISGRECELYQKVKVKRWWSFRKTRTFVYDVGFSKSEYEQYDPNKIINSNKLKPSLCKEK